MVEHSLLADLILTYAVALTAVVLLARVRVPAVVAFMIAGFIAGPGALGFISTAEDVEMLAELGIVLLLFTVGLDFSLAAVRDVWKTILSAGVMQVIGTAAIVAAVMTAIWGTSAQLATFLGLFVALSSTAIVLQALAERNELSAPHGRMTVGILLLQDLAIVVLLLLVPILSGKTALSAVPMALVRAILAIVAIAVASRIVLPRLLRFVTVSGRREVFPLAIVLASIGTAWIGTLFGLSMAVGAFLAGLMLAESEFSHQAYAEVRPVRDVLSGLFFISLGMLIDPATVAKQLPLILLVAVAIIGTKAIVASGALIACATPARVAVTAGLALAQVGEFSFILGQAGLASGLLPPGTWQVLLAASVASMMVTPAVIAAAPVVASRFIGRRSHHVETEITGALSGHVIVIGFGAGGQLVARALRELGIDYVVLELNGATVRQGLAQGEKIFYGDSTSPESLHAAGLEKAAALVSLMSDPEAALRMVRAARQLAPHVPVIVRTRYRLEAERLQAMGAAIAVAEEMEASLEVVAQLLTRLDVSGNLIDPLLDVFRRETTSLRAVRAPNMSVAAVPDLVRQLPVATYTVRDEDWGAGRSLGDINLRAVTGASILAIKRGERFITSLSSDAEAHAGDVLYLVGDDSDMLLARHRLARGDERPS